MLLDRACKLLFWSRATLHLMITNQQLNGQNYQGCHNRSLHHTMQQTGRGGVGEVAYLLSDPRLYRLALIVSGKAA